MDKNNEYCNWIIREEMLSIWGHASCTIGSFYLSRIHKIDDVKRCFNNEQLCPFCGRKIKLLEPISNN